MEATTPDEKPEASKPVNWYSGWRLFATAAATVLSTKLIGILGTAVAVGLFLWLQPKRGTGLALSASAIFGVLVAVVFSAMLLPAFSPPQTQPAVQQAPEWIPAPPNLKPFEGKLDGENSASNQAPPAPGVSPNNPFLDPNLGKDLLK